MPIYRHHLQNRRLRVQVLVPLPHKKHIWIPKMCPNMLLMFFSLMTYIGIQKNKNPSVKACFPADGFFVKLLSWHSWVIVAFMTYRGICGLS